jgi:hypothetical protein
VKSAGFLEARNVSDQFEHKDDESFLKFVDHLVMVLKRSIQNHLWIVHLPPEEQKNYRENFLAAKVFTKIPLFEKMQRKWE